MQAHLTRPENPAQKITYRVRDHGVVLISAWGISAVDDYQPLAGFRTLAAVAGVGDSARACIAGARITSSDNAGSRHFVDCRQSYPWDYFRIARHSSGIAPIDHTNAFDGKTARHSGN